MISIPAIAILAGGLATRLGKISEVTPKSMVEIHGTPFIDFQLRNLVAQGITRVVLCVGHKSASIEDFVGNGSRYGISVQYSHDGPFKLGTGGALQNALPYLGEKFLVTYGDSYLRADIRSLTETHLANENQATMTIFRNDGKYDSSNVQIVSSTNINYSKGASKDFKYIDYGLSIISAHDFSNFIRNAPWELSEYFEEISIQNELGYLTAKDRFYEIGSISGLADFRSHIDSRES